MSGSELSLDKTVGRAVVVLDSDSDSDCDYARDEELLASDKKSSMRKDSDLEKLTGKKRTADIFQEDSPVELEETVEKGQDANKKLKGYDLTVRCEPNKICEVVALLNEPQREKLKELGFGCLLDFKMNKLGSRHLIVFVMDHFHPDTMVLDFGGNRKLYISEHTVWCVLGLQRGKLDPPLSTDNIKLLSSLKKELGIPGKNVEVKYLEQKIQSGSTDRLTMQCFMMIVFDKLLACRSSIFITAHAWRLVQNIDNFGDMNWCKFTVNQLWHSARKWKEPGGNKNVVYGCPAFLVMLYLDNLDCKQKMRREEVPRAKFFGDSMIWKLLKPDKLLEANGLATFGYLNVKLRSQRGTCYDEKAESSKHVSTSRSIPGTNDIVVVFPSLHNKIGDLACKSLCAGNKSKAKQQQLNSPPIEEQQTVEISEDEDALIGVDEKQTTACISIETGQGETSVLEASAEVCGDQMLSGVHEDHGIPEPGQSDHSVTGVSEDGGNAVLVHSNPGTSEAVQLASTFVNEQVKDFMEGATEPEVLDNRLSKLVNLLAQMRALVASDTRTSEFEQQVKELTQRLCKTEEELEATRATLKGALVATQDAQSTLADTQEELEATRATLQGAKAGMLEAQSAAAAINSLALRLSATFVRLGDTRPCPTPNAASSLEEAVKLLEDRVSHIEPLSRGHAMSLAQSSAAFVAAALLCRDREKGFESLLDAVAADTRSFVRSQGPEFHSLVAQVVVDAMEQQQGNALQMQGCGRGTGNASTSK
ncbi:unnamed protein product [Urochloa decumbens]|uniref:Uncharacterized protein n=1 Tax=Urochloa decumbens TaxID=240449 RepID=A0ABC8WG86_9POAL